MDTKQNDRQRYQYLLVLCQQGVATDAERSEFFDLCERLLYATMWDNIDVFKRLAQK